jgi:hypothetical protein|tara:strand:- start:2844 stop:3671 length:828 start_codon:yes stop_codon:yes gene_type:complete
MAVQETRVLPAPFIEAGGKTFLEDLQTAVGKFKDADLSKIFGPQFVAGQDQLQKDAQQLAISGIGGYQPFLQAAAASAGPTGFQQFMSPYQQDVIDTTLKEFDVQAQKGIPGLAASAIGAGAFGGGREGVQRAVYGSESDRNRAALAANLRERGFQQAQQLAQQNIANQLRLGGAQQGFLGQDVGVLSTLGGANQAQAQAELDAQQQLAQQQLNQPLTAAQQYGSGVTSLIAGYPGQTRQTNIPSPSAIQTGLSTGSTLAGIYRLLQGPSGGLFG